MTKILDVEHSLGIWQIRIVDRQSCINAIGGAKVRNSTWNWDLWTIHPTVDATT